MVLASNGGEKRQKKTGVNKRSLYVRTITGITLLTIPIGLVCFDPILIGVQRRLCLENGSMLHGLLLSRFVSTKLHIYMYNVSNAEKFLDGTDEKIHLEEVGPFVYQEYRSNLDVEINAEPGIMRYTPKLEAEFLPEESIGDPRDINVTVPNIAMLRLCLENGSMLHGLLLSRFVSTKLHIYMYNVSNAEKFLEGTDEKIHLEEVGPFVYQEYRSNLDVEINAEPGIMRYTPKLEAEFLLEESIGDPRDINVTVPNIAMLAATAMISKHPFFLRQIFNMLAAGIHSRPFVSISAYDHLWGYSDPFIKLANNVVPGLIYFNSVGLFERMYDIGVDYRMELGTTASNKFCVKKTTRIPPKNGTSNNPKVFIDSIFTFNDTYEGAVFPPYLTPDRPINIYRHGLCKTFEMAYEGIKRMPYGGDGFVYRFHDKTFNDQEQCNTNGWCPKGLMNIANCFFGFPLVLSKGHFLDADPRLLEMVEGLKPNRTMHDTEMVIDPIIGIAISGSMSLQLNLALADVGYNPHTRRLKDTVLPISYMHVHSPPMLKEVSDVLHLMYKKRPMIMLSIEITCVILALLLLIKPVIFVYRRICQGRNVKKEKDVQKSTLLIKN